MYCKCNLNMYRLIFMILAMVVAFHSQAAGPPASLKYLDGHFDNDPNAALTVVMGKPLKEYNLDEYRGLTLKYTPEKAQGIEESVVKDSQSAVDKEMSYRKGKLYYAFLTLPITHDGKNRYLFYLNQTLAKGDKVILIYMCGKASTDKIRKLIKK